MSKRTKSRSEKLLLKKAKQFPMGKIVHFMYVPFTGLGLYGGFRGDRWLRNRIEVFKRFVLPSLTGQLNKNFVVWISWRPEEKENPIVKQFKEDLENVRDLKVVFTYGGLCFWDDKYEDSIAAQRLMFSLLQTLPNLTEVVGDAEYVYMTIQPSDDLYSFDAVETIQNQLPNKQGEPLKVIGWQKGYIMNYATKEIAEYNPSTNPPFYTILFPKEVFLNAKKNFQSTGPYKSHEYVVELMDYQPLAGRCFCVGTHGENISTYFNHPFKGQEVTGKEKEDLLYRFNTFFTKPLVFKFSWRKKLLNKMPHWLRRKIRYYCGELFWAKIIEFLRSK